jgi:hypothetical protein
MHCNGGSFHNIMPNIIPTSNTIHTSHAAMADQGLHLGREATAVRSSVQIYYGEVGRACGWWFCRSRKAMMRWCSPVGAPQHTSAWRQQ